MSKEYTDSAWKTARARRHLRKYIAYGAEKEWQLHLAGVVDALDPNATIKRRGTFRFK